MDSKNLVKNHDISVSIVSMEKELKQKLLTLLKEFISENEIELDDSHVISEKTRLIGATSIFDSMELVQFIVEVESMLEESLDIEMELTSEKAMSRSNSPFISIDTLSKYIMDESK